MSSKDSRFKTRRTQAREGDYVSCSSGDEPEEVYSNAVEKEYVGDVQSGDESYREEFYTGRESSAREEQPMPFLVQGDDAIDDSGLASDRVAARGPVVDDADIEKLFLAARHGKHKELKTLLDKGIPPNMADQHGNTILIIACQNGNKRVVSCLPGFCMNSNRVSATALIRLAAFVSLGVDGVACRRRWP